MARFISSRIFFASALLCSRAFSCLMSEGSSHAANALLHGSLAHTELLGHLRHRRRPLAPALTLKLTNAKGCLQSLRECAFVILWLPLARLTLPSMMSAARAMISREASPCEALIVETRNPPVGRTLPLCHSCSRADIMH